MSINSIDLQNTLSNILRRLDELDRKVDYMNRNFDLLLTQSNAKIVPGSHNPLASGNVDWNYPNFGKMCGRSAEGSLNPTGTPPHTPAIFPGDVDTLWQLGDPSYFEELNSLCIVEDPYPLQADLAPLPGISNDLPTFPQRMAPGSTVDVRYSWADQVPPPTSSVPISLPPVTPGEISGYGAYDDGNFDVHYNDFTSGEHNDHQSTQHTAGNPAQEPELSVGLAITGPENEGGDTQLESSSPVHLVSTYDKDKRAERERQKVHYLRQICEEMRIDWTSDKLLVLQKIVERSGWTVPQSGYATGERRGNGQAIKACYEELRRHVGPWTERIVQLTVLENVLARVQRGGEEHPGGSGSGKIVFSL